MTNQLLFHRSRRIDQVGIASVLNQLIIVIKRAIDWRQVIICNLPNGGRDIGYDLSDLQCAFGRLVIHARGSLDLR